jgi:hypothetical protein
MLLYSNTVIGNIFLKGGHEEVAQKNATIVQEKNGGNKIKLRIIASQDLHKQVEKLMVRKKEEEKAGRGGLLGAQKLEILLVDTIQQQKQRLQNKISFLVIDSKVCIVEEERRKANNFKEVASLATYTNTESIVLAHISIFETLWSRSELKKDIEIER